MKTPAKIKVISDDELTIKQMATRSAKQKQEYDDLAERYETACFALKQLAEANLHEGNCASFEVANRRIRNIAKQGLGIT